MLRTAAKGFQSFNGFGIPPEDGEAASIDLRSIFGTLLRHWRLLSIVPLLALIRTPYHFYVRPTAVQINRSNSDHQLETSERSGPTGIGVLTSIKLP